MKAVHTLALGLAAFTPLASAWPKWLPDVDALIVRQNDETSSAAPTRTAAANTDATSAQTGAAATATTAEATKTTSGPKTTNLNTAKTGSGTKTGSATGTESGKSKETVFDDTDPQGSVVMIDPATTAATINLYKIGDNISWKWNYTNVQANPTAVDVLLSCSELSQSWTLTANMTWAEPASLTWDSSVQKTDPLNALRNAEYTLVIYDADLSVTATAAPGYLGVSQAMKFGMYLPQAYKNLSDWECIGCSSGASTLDNKAINMAVGMSIVTITSFTWFVAGLGVF